jgi:lysophospholipid hydrolase
VVLAAAGAWIVRYRLLNRYERLPPEPQRKEPEIDMFPETKEENTKSGLSGYLDEFLSAIRIFGYLERSVFHELTRSMQTRQLIAGETFNLEEEKGFCIVVDGLVDIFVKSRNQDGSTCCSHSPRIDTHGPDEDSPPGIRYQLLTEVRNASPMSSLFSIMSLFTEDVDIRPPEDDSARHTPAGSVSDKSGAFPSSANFADIPEAMSESPAAVTPHDAQPTSSLENGEHHDAGTSTIPPMSLDGFPRKPAKHRPSLPRRAVSTSAHPDIIARAAVDTTIAIIPASAFRRIIKMYPKATAHIVHLILSRFQRITLATAYNYLGLTGEVLQTEKRMIRYTTCQLPNTLRGEPLSRLKEKFRRERDRVGDDEIVKGIALHNAAANRPRATSKTSLRKEASLQATIKQQPVSLPRQATRRLRDPTSPQSPSPGDLLTNVHFARNGGRRGPEVSQLSRPLSCTLKRDMLSPLGERAFDPFDAQTRVPIDRLDSLDDDNVFRVSVLECMFKALGFGTAGSTLREPESSENSPRLVSFDQRRSTAVFSSTASTATNNVFGFMGAFDSGDGDTESVASGSIAMGAQPNAHALAVDVKDELEIVFFPKGSVLVEEGERNPGIYYVIDGFLDMCTSSDESSAEIMPESLGGRRSLHFDPFSSSSEASPFESFEFGKNDKDPKKDREAKGKKRRRSIALIKPGGLAGYVGTVSSYRSFIDVVAETDVFVGFLPRQSLERIVDKYPIALLTMAKRLTNVLPRLLLHIDFALEWVQVNAGKVLFNEDDESEAIYIVLNGRLRLVTDKKGGGLTARAEYGQGESVGELEVLTESTRPGTLHAIRDTELVKFPRTLFNSLAQEHPNITIKISKIIASRMRALVDNPTHPTFNDSHTSGASTRAPSSVNLRTVAILPVSSGVPVVEFGNRLMAALTEVGVPNGATSLNQAAILKHLGKHAFNKIGKLRLSQYLADLEEKYGLVVYVAGKCPLGFLSLASNVMHDDKNRFGGSSR